MYSVDSKGRYTSYASGFSDANNHFSLTSFQDKYFQKRQFIQEMVNQQDNEIILADIAQEIDGESLKEYLEYNVLGKISVDSNNQSHLLQEITQESKGKSIQGQQNKEAIKSIFEKSFIATNAFKPQNISEEVLKAYNPLEARSEDIPQNAVSFVDEVSGKTIYVPLNEGNIKRLNEKFGSLEKASDYVKGWYYDAAYEVGYLSSDKDGDGSISIDEGIYLKSLVSVINSQYYSIAESIPAGEQQQKRFLEQIGFMDNLTDFINHSIAQDTNLDGDLNLKEVMGNNNEIMLFATKDLQTLEITDIFIIKHFNFSLGSFGFDDFLLSILGINQGNISVDEKKDVSLEAIKLDEIGVWMKNAKISKDRRHLNALSGDEQAKLLKTNVILGNLLKSH